MSPETPVNVETTLRNTNTSPIYQNSPNTEDLYVEISQPQPDIELTQKSLPSSPICSPLRQKLRRVTESYEDLIGGQATFGIGQSSRQEMPWKNVEPNSPLPYTLNSSIPDIPNNLSSPRSSDYNISTPDSIWTLIYQQASVLDAHTEQLKDLQPTRFECVLDAHTEQLKDLQPTRFEWYDRNLDTLFKRADAERRAVFDLGMKVGEIKDKTNQELGNLDSRIRHARREHGHTHGRVEDIERTLWMARDTARTQGQKISALETMLANQMNMCQERFSNMEATQLELEKEVRYLRQRRN
ncbi:hypothetical protein CTI12_AA338250 [Artemisia annua]|uniref:Uncharacterized protein n=1 Tax=Artemisia annua TaxID=35608 RepID=A0A2U1MV53_ARTAN|nr:hypothetical protein CTI12_AA338250 [Artemisia annua]